MLTKKAIKTNGQKIGLDQLTKAMERPVISCFLPTELRKPSPMNSTEAIELIENSLRKVKLDYEVTVAVLNIFAGVRAEQERLQKEFDEVSKEDAPAT